MLASHVAPQQRRFLVALGLWALVLAASPALAASPLSLEQMGHPETDVAPGVPLASDPKASEVTVARPQGVVFLGHTALEADLRFWNHRLTEVHLQFPRGDYGALVTGLGQLHGRPARDEVSKGDHQLTWYVGPALVSVEETGQFSRVWLDDRSQQDFRWSDLLTGTGLVVVAVFAGVLVAWFVLVSLASAWCPKCRAFTMKQGDRVLGTPQDVSGDLLSTDYRSSVTYRYQCTRCGHRKEDHSSAFSQRNRS